MIKLALAICVLFFLRSNALAPTDHVVTTCVQHELTLSSHVTRAFERFSWQADDPEISAQFTRAINQLLEWKSSGGILGCTQRFLSPITLGLLFFRPLTSRKIY